MRFNGIDLENPQAASRGRLTRAMNDVYPKVRKHEAQIDAMLTGIQQLMDGQAALGKAFEALRKRVDELAPEFTITAVKE